jgi:hypothetical protein
MLRFFMSNETSTKRTWRETELHESINKALLDRELRIRTVEPLGILKRLRRSRRASVFLHITPRAFLGQMASQDAGVAIPGE